MAESLNTCVILQYNPAQTLPARPCGLDALYLNLGPAPFSKSFEKLRRQHPNLGRPREDYRSFGLPIILHHPDFPKWRKVEFVGVGTLNRDEIIATLQKITDTDVMALRVYRIDLVADIIGGTSIDRLRESVRVRNKRRAAQYSNPNRTADKFQVQRREYGPCETMYFGSSKSKDFIRVYDKSAKLKIDHPGSQVPKSWVRFERSLFGKGVPRELGTLGLLFQNGANYVPFSLVEIEPSYDVTPEQIYELEGTLNRRMNAAFALTMIRQHGRAEASRRIQREGKNPKEVFGILDHILSKPVVPLPTTSELAKVYQRNFTTQLLGSHANLDDLFEQDEQMAMAYNNRRVA